LVLKSKNFQSRQARYAIIRRGTQGKTMVTYWHQWRVTITYHLYIFYDIHYSIKFFKLLLLQQWWFPTLILCVRGRERDRERGENGGGRADCEWIRRQLTFVRFGSSLIFVFSNLKIKNKITFILFTKAFVAYQRMIWWLSNSSKQFDQKWAVRCIFYYKLVFETHAMHR